MRRMRSAMGIALACLTATALAGCVTSDDATPEDDSTTQNEFTGEVPSFSGVWAADFAEMYRMTTDETAHRILAKESITDADYSEIGDQFIACMAAKDFTVTIDDAYGRFSVTNSVDGNDPVVQKALRECSRPFDVVSGLRARMLRNPQHLDENTIVAACLVKAGLVDKDYSAKDYARELDEWTFSFNHESDKAGRCFNDPLGLETRGG